LEIGFVIIAVCLGLLGLAFLLLPVCLLFASKQKRKSMTAEEREIAMYTDLLGCLDQTYQLKKIRDRLKD
jgi:hypothetical protein